MPDALVLSIIHKYILLATGAPGSNVLRDEIIALYDQNDDLTSVNPLLEAFMNQQAQANEKGLVGTIQNVANNGFGLKLSEQETQQLITDLGTDGIDSWSKLFAFAITEFNQELHTTLDQRSEAANLFTDQLAELNKDNDYSSTQTARAAQEWLAGIDASEASFLAASEAIAALINRINDGNVEGNALDGYISGATVFIDENNDGLQNDSEISTTTDALGQFTFSDDVPDGHLILTGGTDIATAQAFTGTLSAPQDSLTISPLTTLVDQLLINQQAANTPAAENILFQSLNLTRVDLSVFDPINVILDQDSSAAQKSTALQLQATTTQVINLQQIAGTLLGDGFASKTDAIQAVNDALLDAMSNAQQNNQTLDLANASVLTSIIVAATSQSSNPGNVTSLIEQTAALLSEMNAFVQQSSENSSDTQTGLSLLFKLQALTQTDISTGIEEVLAGSDLSALVAQFSGDNLELAVTQVVAGSLDGTIPVNGAPALVSSTPADNAAAVAISSNIVLSFSEPVAIGTGDIIISDGTDTRTIAVTDTDQVSFSGNTVTINPTADLNLATDYHVQIGSGVILSTAGQVYTGISDTNTLNFSTPIAIIELSAIEQNNNNGGFVINGVSMNDQSGFSVSSAGDVNGDGLADLIVGALGDDPNGSSSGASFVVFGKSSGANVELSAIENGSGGFVINGVSADDQSGTSVSNAGDVNGDGLADLIVGALGDDPNGNYSGASFVVFGKSSGTTIELSAVEGGTGGFVINGISADDQSGTSVSSAGDVNGDGLADLIVGALGDDPNGSSSGASFVVFGKSSGANVELSDIENGSGGFVINGVSENDVSGRSVSSAGDVNGDGLADLIVGALGDGPNGSSSGASFVVFGKSSGANVELSDIENGSGGFVINGVSENDVSGRSVSSAGDVNGDGLADLIVGAYFDDPNGSSSGASFIVFGKINNTAIELSNIEAGTGGFVINGVNDSDFSGHSVDTAGDVNGDGLADLIVAAPGDDPNGDDSGASFVVFGKSSGANVELSDIENGNGGFVINGVSADDSTGSSVSSAGDVNGDGFADLIVGAIGDDPNGDSSGTSFVVFGGQNSSATVGTSGADTITGNDGANQIAAGAGNDVLVGNGGADVLRGGAGNDILSISDLTFTLLDGGGGSDILRFDSPLNLDFRAQADSKVTSIEEIDLTDDGGNSTLSFNITDILNINEIRTAANTLTIRGNTGDIVNLDDSTNGQSGSWVNAGAGIYEFDADGSVGVIGVVTIDDAVTVNLV